MRGRNIILALILEWRRCHPGQAIGTLVSKAAEQGYTDAQFVLGFAYWSGEGVIEDQREAYIWYSIAKVNGDEIAASILRSNHFPHLSQDEISSAKKEAARRLDAIDNRADK